MSITFKNRSTNNTQYLESLAQSSSLFDKDFYEKNKGTDIGNDFLTAIASVKDKVDLTFDHTKYNLFEGEDKYSYLMNEFYGKDNPEEYTKNTEYFNQKAQQKMDENFYNSLNEFQKITRTVGGIVGNALNETVLGTIEGLFDVGRLIGGASNEDISSDMTGVARNREALSEFARKNTYIDKSFVAGLLNDVTTGISKLAPNLIPGVGQAIYFGAMAGNSAESAIQANPHIDRGALWLYTAGMTATEFATEKLFGDVVFGKGIFNPISKGSNAWSTLAGSFLSEASEEMASEIIGSMLFASIVDNSASMASIQDVLYAGLIGGIIGGITTGSSIARTNKIGVDVNGKTELLSKFESWKVGQTLQDKSVQNLANKDALVELKVKYSTNNLETIKTKYPAEYDAAVKANQENNTMLLQSTAALTKIFEMTGEAGFKRANDVLEKFTEQQATTVKNFLARQSNSSKASQVEEQFAKTHPGESIQISRTLTSEQLILQKNLKEVTGRNIEFATFGAKSGSSTINGITSSEDTIIVDTEFLKDKSYQQVIESKVLKEELALSLMYNKNALSPQNMTIVRDLVMYENEYNKMMKKSAGYANAKESHTAKDSIRLSRAVAQSVLYDGFTAGRLFATNPKVFTSIHSWLKNKLKTITTKNSRGRLKFNLVAKTIKNYNTQAVSNVYSTPQLEALAKQLGWTAEERAIANRHFQKAEIRPGFAAYASNISKQTLAQNEAMKELRLHKTSALMFDYSKAFNEDYYDKEYVEFIKQSYPNEPGFKRKLNTHLLKTHGAIINEIDGTFIGITDISPFVKDNAMDNLLGFITDIPISNPHSDVEVDQAIFDDGLTRDPNFKITDSKRTLASINMLDFYSEDILEISPRLGEYNLKLVYVLGANAQSKRLLGQIDSKTKEITVYVNSQTVHNLYANKEDALESISQTIIHETIHTVAENSNLGSGSNMGVSRALVYRLSDEQFIKLYNVTASEPFDGKDIKQLRIDESEDLAFTIYNVSVGEAQAKAAKVEDSPYLRATNINFKKTKNGFKIRSLGNFSFLGDMDIPYTEVSQHTKDKNVNPTSSTRVKGEFSYDTRTSDKIKEEFAQLGIHSAEDLKARNFDQAFINMYENDKLTTLAIKDYLGTLTTSTTSNVDSINFLIKMVYPNNKNLKTFEDVSNLQILIPFIELAKAKKLSTNEKKVWSVEEFNQILEDNKNNLAFQESFTYYTDRFERLISTPKNKGFVKYALNKDFKPTFNDHSKIMAALAMGIGGEGALVSETVNVTKKDSEAEVARADLSIDPHSKPTEDASDNALKALFNSNYPKLHLVETFKKYYEPLSMNEKGAVASNIVRYKEIIINNYGEKFYNLLTAKLPPPKKNLIRNIDKLKKEIVSKKLDSKQEVKDLFNLDTKTLSYEKLFKLSKVLNKVLNPGVVTKEQLETKKAEVIEKKAEIIEPKKVEPQVKEEPKKVEVVEKKIEVIEPKKPAVVEKKPEVIEPKKVEVKVEPKKAEVIEKKAEVKVAPVTKQQLEVKKKESRKLETKEVKPVEEIKKEEIKKVEEVKKVEVTPEPVIEPTKDLKETRGTLNHKLADGILSTVYSTEDLSRSQFIETQVHSHEVTGIREFVKKNNSALEQLNDSNVIEVLDILLDENLKINKTEQMNAYLTLAWAFGQKSRFSPEILAKIEKRYQKEASLAGSKLVAIRHVLEKAMPIETLEEDFKTQFKKDLKLPKEMIDQYNKAVNEKDWGTLADLETKILRLVVEQIPDKDSKWLSGTKAERMEGFKDLLSRMHSFRYLAMLSNPATHLRNILSNKTMGWLDFTTKKMMTFFQTFMPQESGQFRYVSNQKVSDKTKAYVKEHIVDNKKIDFLVRGEKYNPSSDTLVKIARSRKLYKTKWLNKVNNFIYDSLDGQDIKSVRPMIIKNLEQMIEANFGNDFSQIGEAELEVMVAEATQNAQKTFFRNNNKFAKTWATIAEKNVVLKIAMGGVIPFSKVASNILMTVYEHSPLNVVHGIAKMYQRKNADHNSEVYNNPFAQAEITSRLAKGTVGTGMFIIGAILASMGLIDLDEEDEYNGVVVKLGEMRIKLADLAPAISPMLLGAAMLSTSEKYPEPFENFTRTLYDQTLLGTFDSMFAYNDSLEDYITSPFESYIKQFVPAIGRGFARTLDPYVKQSEGKMINQILSGIPIASHLVTNKIDPYTGKPMTRYDTPVINEIFNIVSPVKVTKKTYHGDLAKQALDTGAKLGMPTGNYSINSQEFKLSKRELEEFGTWRGQFVEKELEKLFTSKEYEAYETEDEKKKAVEKVYSKATEISKINYWLKKGNSYVFTSVEDYKNYGEYMIDSSRAVYKQNHKGSKFINK